MSGTPTFGRYAEIPIDQMTAEQRDGYRFLVDGPRGRLPGPYKVWVHNPKLVHAAAPLGQHFTPGQSSLTEREREIAVIIITSKWHSAYPTAAHEKRGKEVGLPVAAVEAMIAGLPASFADPREQVVYEVATTLAGGQLVSQGLYDRAVKALGHVSVTDMIVLMGYYTAVSLTMNLYAVPAGSPGLAR
jgi:4-carboxymuconolactone decarboxylase